MNTTPNLPKARREAQMAPSERKDEVAGLLDRMMPEIKRALPMHMTPERMARVTLTAIRQTPKLLECDRKSLMASIMACAQLGLEPNSPLGHAYLIPYGKEAQLVIGYKGLLLLAWNSGEIQSIQAHEVCERDHFSYSYGLSEHLEHIPATGERGRITHFYAYAKFKNGGSVFEVMTLDQVEGVRNASSGYQNAKRRGKDDNPWIKHFVEMGRKTAIRRIAKYLPLSVQRAAALDIAAEGGRMTFEDGDIVIEGQATEADENIGISDDHVPHDEPEPETTPEPAVERPREAQPAKKEAKKKAAPAAAKKDVPKVGPGNWNEEENGPRFEATDDGEVLDNLTGEVIPETFVKWFDNGFSVLKGYHEYLQAALGDGGRSEAQEDDDFPGDTPAEEPAKKPAKAGLFGDDD